MLRWFVHFSHFCTDPGTNIQQLLLVTMISRVAKILLRSLMRNINSTNDGPFFEAIVECAAHFPVFSIHTS